MKSNEKETKTKPIEHKNTDFYRAFEDRHRGPRELILTRLKVYLDFVEPLKTLYTVTETLDLGCGRGEWLQLMQSNGFKAKGIDLDSGMLSACRELKLDVYQCDALNYLRGAATESLTVVSAFHLVEHISFDTLRELVEQAHRALKPGGLLILETPNSENLIVGTSSFYLDPTHQRPLPAQLLSFVVEYAGFGRVSTLYLQESPDLATAQKTTLIDVLNGVSPDYAVVAQKNAPADILALFDTPFNRSYGIRLDSLASSYDQQVELRVAQVEEKMQLNADKLENELDPMTQHIEVLSKNIRQLETELEAELQKAESLITQLSQANEKNTQQQIQSEQINNHSQWLQSEWDSTKQRVEELSKSTGQLETALAIEQQKAESLVAQLTQANEQNAQQQIESEQINIHSQLLQSEWDSTKQRVEELSNSQWLQSEWDSTKQRVEELSKSNGQLETALAIEQQKAESLVAQLTQANEQNAQQQIESEQINIHSQWLQSEWDSTKQRVEELSKSTGQLETELAIEQQKAESLVAQLSQANEQNAQLQIQSEQINNHSQLLQSGWDAAKQHIEELSKSSGRLETELAAEQAKAINLALELNAANEHNTQLQAHAQWLQNEWDAASAKVDELNHSAHRWWTEAEQLRQEQQSIYSSKFWRFTWPLRKIMQAAKWTLVLPVRTVRWALRLPKRITRSLLQRTMRSGLIADTNITSATSQSPETDSAPQNTVAAYPPNMPEESIINLSPRAARIYTDLKKAIEARKN
jgi:SAM-dependent methyltransferase